MESVRKHANILVIDDNVLPAMAMFKREGYHIERWSEVKNLTLLTEANFHLILLDIHGVGLKESPDLQGLGVLKHIKVCNPAQPVVIYSSQPQAITSTRYLMLADALLDKKASYVDFKECVDHILSQQATPGHFVSAMNRTLGEDAALAPRATAKALSALRRGNTAVLDNYLRSCLTDPAKRDKIELIVRMMATGVNTVKLFAS